MEGGKGWGREQEKKTRSETEETENKIRNRLYRKILGEVQQILQ
jgi:hypothetical protein